MNALSLDESPDESLDKSPDAPPEAALESVCTRLKETLLRLVPEPGKKPTGVDGLHLIRWNAASQTDSCFCEPAISIILQGRKESIIGSEVFKYGALDCLLNGVDMPSASRVVSASPEAPLLAIVLTIDRRLVAELVAEMPFFSSPSSTSGTCGASGRQYLGVSVTRVTADVLDAFARLVNTLHKPEQLTLLAPLLVREVLSRVLMGPQGGALRTVHTPGTHGHQVAEAITWLRANYTDSLQIDTLAGKVNMATSTFHRQFKQVTSLSPLQFQKRLRLYEAQRLMLAESLDANSAGRTVGYDSIQQFSREYKRMFGDPPHRDIARLRNE